jgi:hypothetical protein
MLARADMKIMELYPRCCHMFEPMYSVRNHSGLEISAPPSSPRAAAIWVSTPLALLKSVRMATTTTTEIKYGRYDMV